MKTIDLGLDIQQTMDIPVIEYWSPNVIKFRDDDEYSESIVVELIDNKHRAVFKDAFEKKKKIQVSGSSGSNPCLWFTVGNYTIVIDTFPEDSTNGGKVCLSNISVFFEDIDNTHVGVIKIKGKSKK